MPKNLKAKKNGTVRNNEPKKFDMVYKEDIDGSAVYGQVIKVLGDCNFSVRCFGENEQITDRLCHLRKSVKKKGRVEVDSIVLVGLRDFQDCKADILYTYHKDQVRELKDCIPKLKTIHEFIEDKDDTGFDFDEI